MIEQLMGFIKLKKCIRQEEKNLKIITREVELGVGCRIALQEITKIVMELGKEELKTKLLI